ncbi:MAG: trypsin-like peptidase domain-containing protein [Coleofasciculus sp. B1-GNL1-01]|uniref:trypsin-like peptidase domain-containing protein n=1 Tax=Coleofasciculus sp. B1-GNL1-01 TaxID=3068484 RepID=UPI0032FC4642
MWQNFSSGLSAALMGAAIVVVQPQIVTAQVDEQAQAIASFARNTTVVINGQNPGSGVIISRQGNTYYVLTAKHVVNIPDEYEIVTSDGVKYPLDYGTVKKLPGLDLALVQFTSDKHYPIALVGDSDTAIEGGTVYISGWPHPGRAITQRIFQITSGKISGRPLESLENGYDLVYTNITRSGMSGGPIWDAQGRVIGIHGQAEGEQIINPDGNTIPVKSGFNLGIPINIFLKHSSKNDSRLLYLQDNFSISDTILSDKRCPKERASSIQVFFNSDYQLIAMYAVDGIIHLCNMTTGQEIQTFEEYYYRSHQGGLGLSLSPDGKTLVSVGREDVVSSGRDDRRITSIKIWNVNTGQLRHTLTRNDGFSRHVLFISRDSKTLASNHGTMIKIWDLSTGKLLHEIDQGDTVTGLSLSPDSQILRSASVSGRIKIWNLATGKLLNTLPWQLPVSATAFSPSTPILAVGTLSSTDLGNDNSPSSNAADATLKIWNWKTGELLWTLAENSQTIDSLAIDPSGQMLASTSEKEIKIWSLHTGQLLRTLDAGKPVKAIGFSADSQTLFSTDLYDLQIWQVAKH